MTAKRYSFTKILGWSYSRYRTFRKCKRLYWYTYYAKHDTEHSIAKIQEINKLSTIPIEVGKITHTVIEYILKDLHIHLEKSRFYNRFEKIKDGVIIKDVRDSVFESKYYNFSNVSVGDDDNISTQGSEPIALSQPEPKPKPEPELELELEQTQEYSTPPQSPLLIEKIIDNIINECADPLFSIENPTNFQEQYYEKENVRGDVILSLAKICVANFLYSPRWKWILDQIDQKKKTLEGCTCAEPKNSLDWIIEPDGFGETRIKNLKAYIKVDFLASSVLDDKEIVHLIDWKTGLPNSAEEARQLQGYAIWATFCRKTQLNQAELFAMYSNKCEVCFMNEIKKQKEKASMSIKCLAAYLLPDYREIEFPCEPEKLVHSVSEETKEMYSYLENKVNNKPLPKEKFEMTEMISSCNVCKFRELCKRI